MDFCNISKQRLPELEFLCGSGSDCVLLLTPSSPNLSLLPLFELLARSFVFHLPFSHAIGGMPSERRYERCCIPVCSAVSRWTGLTGGSRHVILLGTDWNKIQKNPPLPPQPPAQAHLTGGFQFLRFLCTRYLWFHFKERKMQYSSLAGLKCVVVHDNHLIQSS